MSFDKAAVPLPFVYLKMRVSLALSRIPAKICETRREREDKKASASRCFVFI